MVGRGKSRGAWEIEISGRGVTGLFDAARGPRQRSADRQNRSFDRFTFVRSAEEAARMSEM